MKRDPEVVVQEMEYKGFTFEISFCTEKLPVSWETKDRFRVSGTSLLMPLEVTFGTIQAARTAIEKRVDAYVAEIPQTKQGWIDAFSECVIQDDYEDWHVDEKMAIDLLKKAAKFDFDSLKVEKKQSSKKQWYRTRNQSHASR